jgi:hypothetical protein
MSKGERIFQLPSRIDRLLATVSKIYMDRGDHQARKVVVNSQVRVQEDREGIFDDYSREMVYGHTVYLDVPESLYPSLGEERPPGSDQERHQRDQEHPG